MDHSHGHVAVLRQGHTPPPVGGIRKPPKPNGYADSSADIACALQSVGVALALPSPYPDTRFDLDWSYPDTHAGIRAALDNGATVLWANTVLYDGHPIETALAGGVQIVGQVPANVTRFDDKRYTNERLRARGLPVPPAISVGGYPGATVPTWDALTPELLAEYGLTFPLVVKPIRGRGSAGVQQVENWDALQSAASTLLSEAESYGTAVLLEAYLPGDEVTISVLPPGDYPRHPTTKTFARPWALPPVLRFNHRAGVAPYNGVVAVAHNSRALRADERTPALQTLCRQCEDAAALVEARAVIRIDCRQDALGNWYLFDLNLKPNLTGTGRPHRDDQNSLTTLAAQALDWDYPTLLLSLLDQVWTGTSCS